MKHIYVSGSKSVHGELLYHFGYTDELIEIDYMLQLARFLICAFAHYACHTKNLSKNDFIVAQDDTNGFEKFHS